MRVTITVGLTTLALSTTACASPQPGGVASAPAPVPPTLATTAPRPAKAAAASADWPTYHRDNARDGLDPGAPPVTGVTEEWRSSELDGKIYASPLVVGDRVIVATEGNSVYALEAPTGKVVWHAQLGSPVDAGSLACAGNIDPSGITGTPVADPAAGVVYVVTFTKPAHHELFALDLASGAVRFKRAIDAPGSDPTAQQQRGALALSQGRVYVPYGGLFGDCGRYHGYVVSAPAADAAGALASYKVPSAREAGIWAPSGPALDAAGNVFVATGNGSSTSRFDFGEAVLRLTPTLKRVDYFAPGNAVALNASDTDLGSTGPALLANGRLFQIGKDGTGYLLNPRRLGHVGHPLASKHVCGGGAYGGDASDNSNVYVPCTDGVVAVRAGSRKLSVAWRGPSFNAGPPIVVGGAVLAVDVDKGVLYALSASDGHPLARAGIGSPPHFTTPAESGGRVLVSGGSRIVAFSTR